jgi:hypothetical protein
VFSAKPQPRGAPHPTPPPLAAPGLRASGFGLRDACACGVASQVVAVAVAGGSGLWTADCLLPASSYVKEGGWSTELFSGYKRVPECRKK